MNEVINIILGDNQGITRIGIEALIQGYKKGLKYDLASTKKMLVSLLISNPDSIVVLDYSYFDFGSVDELLNVSARFPNTHWILFSDELSADFLKRLFFSSESFSVVLKGSDLDEINLAIASAFHKERFICQRVVNQLLLSNKAPTSKSDHLLTPTEKEILKEIASGKTTKEIASTRNLSFHTIITHRKNIFRKLEVNNVYEATKYAVKAGIVDVTDYYI